MRVVVQWQAGKVRGRLDRTYSATPLDRTPRPHTHPIVHSESGYATEGAIGAKCEHWLGLSGDRARDGSAHSPSAKMRGRREGWIFGEAMPHQPPWLWHSWHLSIHPSALVVVVVVVGRGQICDHLSLLLNNGGRRYWTSEIRPDTEDFL